MKTTNIKRYLDSFAGQVVNDAKLDLSNSKDAMGKSRGDTALGQSIRSTVEITDSGFSVKFYMLDYGTFLDKGVSGNKTKRSFTNYKQINESSPYSYTTKGPPIDIISKWIKKKGIEPKGLGRGRSKNTGQYVSGFAYLISKKIKREGIKSISFFQKPLGAAYTTLKDDLLKNIALDIQTYITTFTKHK
tara:strand:+ start:2437 stop:3003 length:567 start_codon:yes stop_codon:yes gene_type:complete